MFVCLFLFVCLYVCMFVCLFVCLFLGLLARLLACLLACFGMFLAMLGGSQSVDVSRKVVAFCSFFGFT